MSKLDELTARARRVLEDREKRRLVEEELDRRRVVLLDELQSRFEKVSEVDFGFFSIDVERVSPYCLRTSIAGGCSTKWAVLNDGDRLHLSNDSLGRYSVDDAYDYFLADVEEYVAKHEHYLR